MRFFLEVSAYYIPFVKTYRRELFFTMFWFGIATLLQSIVSPLALKSIVDTVSSSSPRLDVIEQLKTIFLVLVGSRVITMISYRLGDYATTGFQTRVMRDIANDVFRRITQHSYEFFSHQFTGSLVSNSNKLVRSFEQIADFITYNLFSEGMRLIIASVVLWTVSPILGLLFSALVTVYFCAYALFFKRSFELNEARSTAESKTTGVLADALTNILSIKMFAQATSEWMHMKHTVDHEYHARLTSWRFGNLQGTVQRGTMLIFELTAVGTALYLWSTGVITSGTIVLLQIYVFSALDIVYNLTRNLTRTISSFADAHQMVTILNTPESVQDPKHPLPFYAQEGAITLSHVTFGYDASNPVFQNFSLTVTPGQKIGLVGHSGSGKTTLVKLLLRFLDVQHGSVKIDGQDVRDVTQDDLRSAIAYVPQDPLLFHRTIRENIRYGRSDASDSEVIEAATRAHAHEFIHTLPHGYETYVGERGVRLSGGERQRVAIARAMIKNAPILILDEATSALDSVSERAIQEAFDDLMKDKTTIVIAHRLSTIQKMDRILVFENGEVIEDGTHTDLLSNGGTYATLWQTQTSGFIE